MGHWDDGGNLHIDSSDTFPDDTAEETIDDLVDEQANSTGMAWAASFEVDSHREACQQAHAEYLENQGGRLIDDVYGVKVDT
ncbi:hypothetical protein [Streptomyces sp. NPDC001089]